MIVISTTREAAVVIISTVYFCLFVRLSLSDENFRKTWRVRSLFSLIR